MNIKYFINNWKNIKEEDIYFSENEWIKISCYKYLAEEFIEKYKDKVNWGYISYYQNLSEEFIKKYQNKVDWYLISIYQSLSAEFIEKYKDKVNWYCISEYQSLSEEFIEKYEDKIHWGCISQYQSLSEEFIYKHKDKISHPDCLNKHYRLRYEKYNDYFNIFSIHANNNYGLIINWKNQMNIKNIPANIIFCKTL